MNYYKVARFRELSALYDIKGFRNTLNNAYHHTINQRSVDY